ncbi:hypothetical protein AWN90_41990 [Nocardia terpenica]|uniref:Uncharacterized protein n=2 Tax=Nocardia terpenica TaxID=455432 RepID=A0A164K6J9_9NOCA|nr:hypothetical protein AWN90_41990 [Nocardia terpenica]
MVMRNLSRDTGGGRFTSAALQALLFLARDHGLTLCMWVDIGGGVTVRQPLAACGSFVSVEYDGELIEDIHPSHVVEVRVQ